MLALPALPGADTPSELVLVPAPPIIDAPSIQAAIARVASAIKARHDDPANLCLIGIANGGRTFTQRLVAALDPELPTGEIDTSFHRDDIGHHPIPQESRPTIIPFDVTGKTVILADDVLHTGRTLNAALNELFDHGRPAAVEVAVLIDRGGRKLPFAADYRGMALETTAAQNVIVHLDAHDATHDSVQVTAADQKPC